MPLNKEKNVNVSVILPKESHEQLKNIAVENKRSVSSLIAIIVEDYLKGRDPDVRI